MSSLQNVKDQIARIDSGLNPFQNCVPLDFYEQREQKVEGFTEQCDLQIVQ